MSSEKPFQLNWGVFGPGRISVLFFNDLLHSKDKLRPDVLSGKISHSLVAIASGSSIKNAEWFKKEGINEGDDDNMICYPGYAELLKDDRVDVVYIATLNSSHFKLCHMALAAGKHVLMEKPFTMNAKQAKILIDFAKEKKLFLMEAFWTKYNPVMKDLTKICFEDKTIGDIKRVHSDLSFFFDQKDPMMNRIFNHSLGGGTVLDIGIYALNWQMNFLDHVNYDPDYLPEVKSFFNFANTGVDISNAIILRFGDDRLGVATCSGFFDNPGPAVVIQGTKGRAVVNDSCRPTSYSLYGSDGKLISEKTYEYDGHAMFFEGDHVALCLMKGMLESDVHTLSHTLKIAKILDAVRAENGLVYPDEIESTQL
ncbi:hypothetical protein CANARDRAFT_27885 [[Candida] arabinofermentans NRRL YB-2248]|uniref:D-xylose 1-dehydrogenase (NADP(+), D-xylono-1,5-lactone-forming) n=1 Tax=[Candida] arabinofermentans NRRL YB-2248 TaxID=983967 RepID=A0A1E4T229_9ASCO|nr:hypothetical protein CANARDRAFT_27885 [[Candida] arabinofermentans NRRL YB-2248]